MKTETILSTVESIAKMMNISRLHHKNLQRYFLHKSTKLSLEQIAEVTETSRMKVYGSIRSIDNNKKLAQTKAMIFAALK